MEDEEKEEFTKIEGVDWTVIYDWFLWSIYLIGSAAVALLLYLIIEGAR